MFDIFSNEEQWDILFDTYQIMWYYVNILFVYSDLYQLLYGLCVFNSTNL